MDARDLFLFEHALAQSAAVGCNKTSVAENVFGGVTDEQMRVRPREDLNSLAWLMWHIAHAEDIMVNPVLVGRDQVLDGGWLSRLRVGRKDFGIGMSKTEVSELTSQIDIGALREYRDDVMNREGAPTRGRQEWVNGQSHNRCSRCIRNHRRFATRTPFAAEKDLGKHSQDEIKNACNAAGGELLGVSDLGSYGCEVPSKGTMIVQQVRELYGLHPGPNPVRSQQDFEQPQTWRETGR